MSSRPSWTTQKAKIDASPLGAFASLRGHEFGSRPTCWALTAPGNSSSQRAGTLWDSIVKRTHKMKVLKVGLRMQCS